MSVPSSSISAGVSNGARGPARAWSLRMSAPSAARSRLSAAMSASPSGPPSPVPSPGRTPSRTCRPALSREDRVAARDGGHARHATGRLRQPGDARRSPVPADADESTGHRHDDFSCAEDGEIVDPVRTVPAGHPSRVRDRRPSGASPAGGGRGRSSTATSVPSGPAARSPMRTLRMHFPSPPVDRVSPTGSRSSMRGYDVVRCGRHGQRR